MPAVIPGQSFVDFRTGASAEKGVSRRLLDDRAGRASVSRSHVSTSLSRIAWHDAEFAAN